MRVTLLYQEGEDQLESSPTLSVSSKSTLPKINLLFYHLTTQRQYPRAISAFLCFFLGSNYQCDFSSRSLGLGHSKSKDKWYSDSKAGPCFDRRWWLLHGINELVHEWHLSSVKDDKFIRAVSGRAVSEPSGLQCLFSRSSRNLGWVDFGLYPSPK